MNIDLLLDIIGWIGAFIYIIAYLLISIRVVDADTVAYQILNIMGGIMVGGNSLFEGALPSTILNGIWSLIGILVLVQLALKRRASTV